MDNNSHFVVGLDIGTENVRSVVLNVDKDSLNVVGYGEIKNNGMRKGIVADLTGPAEAIDKMLGEVERMSGYEVNSAFVSINGSHLLSTKVEGMIAMGSPDHELTLDDLHRIEEVSVLGRIPANRNVLDLVPIEYRLDGQGGIKDPLGMTGSRLELKANVISALTPNCENLSRATENASVHADRLIPSCVAAGRAVLSPRQRENGVALVDLGSATTSVAIYEEGDLRHVAVLAAGSNNITDDLAIVLEIDTEIAEMLKRKYATGGELDDKPAILKIGREEHKFDKEKLDEVVKARLNDIFDRVRKELKSAHYDKRLPEGIVLTGGGAHLRDIDLLAHRTLEASVRIGLAKNLGGVADAILKPEYAAAAGLAILASESAPAGPIRSTAKKPAHKSGGGFFKKLFSKF